ncbi:MAG: hypothetical protein AVDCRST_MAG68-5690, partial [uncultured Gemmatimonadetes bacterium]
VPFPNPDAHPPRSPVRLRWGLNQLQSGPAHRGGCGHTRHVRGWIPRVHVHRREPRLCDRGQRATGHPGAARHGSGGPGRHAHPEHPPWAVGGLRSSGARQALVARGLRLLPVPASRVRHGGRDVHLRRAGPAGVQV